MSIFINLDTMEYPRYAGDVDLSPESNWAEVLLSTPPTTLKNEIAYEIQPELIDGNWYQKWNIRNISEEEILISNNIMIEYYKKMGFSQEDLDRLMQEGNSNG